MATVQRPRIAYFKENLPTPLCVFFSFFFALAFQFNGGVFLPTALQMSSELGYIKEDVSMAGYASFIGMTIIFPILFRLKFRFTTRSILLTVCPVLIVCNLGMFHFGFLPHVGNVRVLLEYATYYNPRRRFLDFLSCDIYHCTRKHTAVWTCGNTHHRLGQLALYALVRDSHGQCGTMVSVVWLCVFLFTRHFRPRKVVPLYNIDWLGAALWVVFLFSVVFICIYGEYFTYPKFPIILLLFLVLCIYLTTSTVLQTLFMSSILKYDTLNSISLNWYAFAGILCGSGIVFYRRVIQHKGFKMLIFIGFCLLTAYQYYMYFLIHPNLNIESLYFPNFIRGIGYGMLYISLTIYIAVSVPFKHFFQALCVLSFIRTSIATPLGTALLNRAMKYLEQDNIATISRNMDQVRAWTEGIPMNTLYNLIRTQTTLTSLKELFGWVCIQGTIFLIIIMSYRLWRDREETFRHPVHKAMNFHRKVKTRMRKRI